MFWDIDEKRTRANMLVQQYAFHHTIQQLPCTTTAHSNMAQPEYPGAPDTAAYDGGDAQAIYVQLRQAHDSEPARVREFAFAAANAVSKLYCDHNHAPEPLPAGLTRDARRASARAHPGLCGYFQSAIVAGVDFEDVVATAEKRNVPVTLKVFRNQVSELFTIGA